MLVSISMNPEVNTALRIYALENGGNKPKVVADLLIPFLKEMNYLKEVRWDEKKTVLLYKDEDHKLDESILSFMGNKRFLKLS